MKSFWLFIFSILTLTISAAPPPHEGLWLPLLIKEFNYNEMKRSGLKISSDQLYHINNPCIKDAIVQIGEGEGSGSIVSDNGLLLTTFNTIFPYITELSKGTENILKNGYWAKNNNEERPCPGLSVTFLKRMENVTNEVLGAIPQNIPEYKRKELVEKKINRMIGKYQIGLEDQVSIESFFYGNEYYLVYFQEYKDVRLVVAPPVELAQFGGEQESWMWPRYNADFALLRIYTAPDGSSAPFSPENIPLNPKYYLPISLKGYQENDFTMIWGYPGRTNRFISSPEMKFRIEQNAKAFVEASSAILNPLRDGILSNDTIKIYYGDLYQSISNQQIRYLGEINNLFRLNLIDEVQKRESQMNRWGLFQDDDPIFFDSLYQKMESVFSNINLDLMRAYWYGNITLLSSRFLMLPYQLKEVTPTPKTEKEIEIIINDYRQWMKGVHRDLEKKMILSSFSLWPKLPDQNKPKVGPYIQKYFNNDQKAFSSAIVDKSIFSSEESLREFLKDPKISIYQKDPLLRYYHEVIKTTQMGEVAYQKLEQDLVPLQREYAGIILKMNQKDHRSFYPDANQTLRVSYGNISGYQPSNAILYHYYTNHIGILEKIKAKPNDPNYRIPSSLKQLFFDQRFGSYEYEDELRICFITNADSGIGSNGSPVLNQNGALIGLMFDTNRESLGNHYLYHSEVHRSICLDVRYMLFLLEHYGGVSYLFEEMNLIQ